MAIDWLVPGLVSLAAAAVPTGALFLARRRIGSLEAASWMVVWGAFIAAGEHALWTLRGAMPADVLGGPNITTSSHIQAHVFMAGVFTLLGGALISVVARTLLREGRRTGWYAILGVLVVGFALELVANGPAGLIFQHGFPPNSLPVGLTLYGYPIAWFTALAISYGEVFGR